MELSPENIDDLLNGVTSSFSKSTQDFIKKNMELQKNMKERL